MAASEIDWINPPSPGPVNWMVGEQQNLSWVLGNEYLSNISLVQASVASEVPYVINGIIYPFYILLIFNYVKLHATVH